MWWRQELREQDWHHRWKERTFWAGQGFRTQAEQGAQGQRPWIHSHARNCQLRVSANSLLYQRGKKPNHFVWVQIVLLTGQNRVIQVYEPFAEEVPAGATPWGEYNSRCSRTCKCPSPGAMLRKGRRACRGTPKFRKQTWSSSNNTCSFFRYQALTLHAYFFGKVEDLLGSENIFQNKIRLTLRTWCQYCRKESTKVVSGSRTHRGRGGRPVPTLHWCAENLRSCEGNTTPIHAQGTTPCCQVQDAGARALRGAAPHLPATFRKQTANCQCAHNTATAGTPRGSLTQQRLILSTFGRHWSTVLQY